MKRMPGIAFAFLLIVFAGYMVASLLDKNLPKDDTDSPDGRNGMVLLTDHLTGCQYLRAGGGVTPRMDRNGKQICR